MSAGLFSPNRKDKGLYQGGKYLKARKRGQTVRWPIPCRPLVQIVDRWVSEQNRTYEDAYIQLNKLTGNKDTQRLMYRLRNEQNWASLTTADMLVTATYGPQLWRTEPELAQAIDWLDQQTGPYCSECWARVKECECVPVAA